VSSSSPILVPPPTRLLQYYLQLPVRANQPDQQSQHQKHHRQQRVGLKAPVQPPPDERQPNDRRCQVRPDANKAKRR
jgi:hypothetical protein